MISSLFPTWVRRMRFLGLYAGLLATLVGSLSAATKTLDVTVGQDRATGRVTLPQGTTAITLQTRDPRGPWRDIETRPAVPGVLVLNLPAFNPGALFRVNAVIEAPSRKKFPSAFYRGRNSFAPSQITPQNDFNRLLVYASAMSPALDAPAPTAESPVEADIWKISGSTAYFFNQLRGLQVVDLSDPASPVLTASYRLPAAGQDLYLLPSAAGFQDVLLVTHDQPPDGSGNSAGLYVIRVEGGSTRLLHSTRVAGYPQGSRLAGRRLFLCTTNWNSGYSNSSTALTEWLVPNGAAPVLQQTIPLSGSFSTLAAGPDWLAVALTPSGRWGISTASVYHLSANGLSALTAGPVTLAGQLNDAYKIQWSGGVLTTISQAWPSGSPRTTWLETFRADGPAATGERLGQLELARGETLHATRFAGDKAYIVTFLQKDPLFVVDLSDPTQPVIAGQVDVPGWSTHIEPIGDKLFTVGWEDGAVAASLFDVANPAAPTLLRRLALTEGYGYSEANWDPQALSVLPDAGLALIPITSYTDGTSTYGVRLVDIDLAGGELHARGLIPGRFEARRAALVGDTAVTLSQRTLATATIADRDRPAILADSLLAWPVDRVLPSGDRVLGVETGGSWSGGLPAVRVSPLASPDSILAELDLPSGIVHDVALRDGRLYVLRESASSNNLPFYHYWFAPLGKLNLDVYDATDPLAPKLLGTCEAATDGLSGTRVSRLLWPRPERPVILVENESRYYWMRPMPVDDFAIPRLVAAPLAGAAPVASSAVMDAPKVAASPVSNLAVNTSPISSWIPWPGNAQPRLIAFDVSNPASPSASPAIPIGPADASTTDVKTAAGGLVVLGYDRWTQRTIARKGGLPESSQSELLHYAQVIVVPAAGVATARPAIDLPGSLFAVTELSAEGFLAFTRTVAPDGSALLQASACDAWDAFQVARIKVAVTGPLAAAGRALYYTNGNTVNLLALNNAGNFASAGTIRTSWAPGNLRVLDGRLLGSTWRRLFSAPADAKVAPSEWSFNTGFDLQSIERAADGSLVIPMGDYGYELARP
jgi:hypothetical protein